jgi:raffinose/stachyose/melibiose transport system substrate-binding protein
LVRKFSVASIGAVSRDASRGGAGSKETSVNSFVRRILLCSAAAALLLTACGGNGDNQTSGRQTIDWWHIQNTDPMLPVWRALAKDYEAAHSDVTIKITPLENEAFKARLTTVTQAGNPPDIFQTWGGGVLRQQVEAGLVKDITADVEPWIGNLNEPSRLPYQIDGKTYGVPFDHGMVGFWYNKALFDKAGIDTPPATWTEFLDAVGKLRAAGVTPIALAGKEKWPAHFYWTYLAIRLAGLDGLQKAAEAKSFEGPEFVAAGEHLKELVDLEPFQKGFLGAEYGSPDGHAALMGNGKAAMELMGQWAPSVQASASGKPDGIGADLGWFPFPSVDGGKSAVTDNLGGGNGFAVGKDAPPAATDFLKFLLDAENYEKAVKTGAFLPVVEDTEDAVTDERVQPVLDALDAQTGSQLYLDQDYPPAVGETINDSVTELIAGTMTPADVAAAITTTAQSQSG